MKLVIKMTNDEFNRLRNQAFEKLKTDRRMFSHEDINDINNIILDMNLSTF